MRTTSRRASFALWSESISNRTIRAYLFDLTAAWDWAVKEGLVECDTNPWSKSLDRLRKKLPTPKKPQPFSEDELRSIVGAFDRLPPSYSHYKDAAIFNLPDRLSLVILPESVKGLLCLPERDSASNLVPVSINCTSNRTYFSFIPTNLMSSASSQLQLFSQNSK